MKKVEQLIIAVCVSCVATVSGYAADTPKDPALAALEADKARYALIEQMHKAAEAAARAKIAAEEAAARAFVGNVPGQTAIAGDTTVGTSALKTHTALLLSVAAGEVAEKLRASLPQDICGKPVVLFTGATALQLSNYQQFSVRKANVEESFKAAEKMYADLVPPSRAKVSKTSIGLTIDALSKLGSYFQVNYSLGPVEVSLSDDVMLTAVAHRLMRGTECTVIMPTRVYLKPETVVSELQYVQDKLVGAASNAAEAARHAKDYFDLAKIEVRPEEKKTLENKSAEFSKVEVALNKAITLYAELMTWLYTGDVLAKVNQEKAIQDRIGDGYALQMSIATSGGEYYTKKSIWNFLGSGPQAYVMAGVVLNYTLVRAKPEWRVAATGLVPVHTGYIKLDEIEDLPGLDSMEKR